MNGKKFNWSGYTLILINLFFIWLISGNSTYSQGFEAVERPDTIRKNAFQYNVSAGLTSVTGRGAFNYLSISSHYRYRFSDRFITDAGVMATHYNQILYPSQGAGADIYGSNSLSLFVTGSYFASPKIVLYGTGVKNVRGKYGGFLPSYESFSMGSSIRLGNVTLGAELRFSEGYWFPGDRFRRDYPAFHSTTW